MIGVVVNGCHSLSPENTQVHSMSDKPSMDFDWLSGLLKSELMISEDKLIADPHKSEHSFVRNLLTDKAVNDKYESIQSSDDADVFDSSSISAKLSCIAGNLSDSAELTEKSDAQVAVGEPETVVKPPSLPENESKRDRLHFQISRTDSVADRPFADDTTDSLLKTPAGFYDRSCASSGLSIPPLFDYSSSLFTNPSHISNATCSFSNAGNSRLCSIVEDEKWSEGSDISSVDIDASSISALSPADLSEDRMSSIAEDEDRLSKQEECVVLSVVQNVLSDEAAIPSLVDSSDTDEGSCDDCQHSPEIPSSENSVVMDSCQFLQSSTKDTTKLNPLARPFHSMPKVPLQPVPVVFTPSMPTVVVPVKFAYTRLVPVATSKSTSSKRPAKNNASGSHTLMLSSNAANNNRWSWPYYSAPAVMPYYYNIGMYYCSPWQPVFSDGRSVIPLKKMLPRVATSDQHRLKSSQQKEVTSGDEVRR